ncbi:MAG: NAD(P)H-dependent oxidoreductase [Devosia sp.]|nr:NAD(P)H-dependent oxidoreductase [Devosia sp.]
MSVHLVLSHPLADSLNAHLAGEVERAVLARGLVLDRLDLYATAFAPALTQEERRGYYEPIAMPSAVADLHNRLLAAEHLIVVFPTWWFAAPAMLKGWFERVWSPGIAFDQGTPIRPRLSGLKSILVITTLGSPWWFDLLIARRPVRRSLKMGVFEACAPQARFDMLSLYEAESIEPARLVRFEARIRRAVERLE